MSSSTPREASPGVLPRDWAPPAIDDTNRAWFTSGAFALQQCAACNALQHPSEEICHVCGSFQFLTRTVAPTGTVYSYTIVHHAVHPALEASVPYAVVLVALDEVPEVRVVGNLLDAAMSEVVIGLPVEAVWDERPTDGDAVVLLPQWRRRRSP
jgi:uncharacterized OB-fold protein